MSHITDGFERDPVPRRTREAALVEAISNCKGAARLTLQEVRELASDLAEHVIFPRRLTDHQLRYIFGDSSGLEMWQWRRAIAGRRFDGCAYEDQPVDAPRETP